MILIEKGTEIFYTDEGKGDTLVFLHGFLENSAMWNELMPSFKKQFRVICIDLLGHGKTGSKHTIHTMEMMADAVAAVLDYLAIKQVILIGHSMGGYVSLALASKQPHRIQKLILLNSTWKSDTREKKVTRTKAIKAVRNNFGAFVKLTIPNLFAEKNRIKLRKEITKVKEEALKTSILGTIAALEGMKMRPDYSATMTGFNFEQHIIIGKEDTLVNPNVLFEEAKKLGMIPQLLDGGHMAHIENRTKVLLILAGIVHK